MKEKRAAYIKDIMSWFQEKGLNNSFDPSPAFIKIWFFLIFWVILGYQLLFECFYRWGIVNVIHSHLS